MENCKGLNKNKAVFNLSGLLFIPSVSETSVINTNFSYVYMLVILIELVFILIYFKYIRGNSKVLQNNKYYNYFINTKLYKATKEANAIPTMNPKVEKFHNNIFVKIFRVIGGISFVILGFSYYEYYTIPFYLHTILFVVVMIHLFYSIVLSLHSLYYIIKAFIRGDFIYRNSPISWLYTGYKGTFVCFKGLCKGVGTAFFIAGSGVTFDHYYGSPICKTWFDTHIRKNFLDTLGIDFPTNPKHVYVDLLEVPNHIKKQVFIDSLNLTEKVNLVLENNSNKELISKETDSKEIQLFLCNLRNSDYLAYNDFIRANNKLKVSDLSELYSQQFRKPQFPSKKL